MYNSPNQYCINMSDLSYSVPVAAMLRIGGMLSQILSRPTQLTWDGIQIDCPIFYYSECLPSTSETLI